jgi:hypothetical protein
MRIVFGVAIETGRRWIRKSSVLVAVEAGGLLVLAEQRVVRRRVIEFGLQPFGWFVAGRTVSAHSVLMGLIFRVTVNARRGCLPPLLVGLMTIVAGCVFVRTQQFEIGEAMVERRFIEDDNACVTANMLRMARRALVGLDLGAATVEPGFLVDVHSDILMAIHAKLPLPALVKSLVAGRAFAFQVRVGIGDRTRHNKGLDILRRGIV